MLQIMGQGRRRLWALWHGLLDRIVEISYLKTLNLEGMSISSWVGIAKGLFIMGVDSLPQ